MRTHRYGFTLMEALVVIGVVTLVSASVMGLFLRSSEVYARSSGRVEPQTSQLLALKRMENEIRQAYTISLSEDDPAADILTLTMPEKNENGLIKAYSMNINAESTADDILIGVKPGDTITYRTIRETAAEGGINFVGDSRIDTFKLVREVRSKDSDTFVRDTEPLIRHITKREEDEATDGYQRVNLFQLASYPSKNIDDETVDIVYSEAHLLKMTLINPYEAKTPRGKKILLHSVSTELLLRNSGRASKNN